MTAFGDNVWDELPGLGEGVRRQRLARADGGPGSAVWELDPGASGGPLHFHHGISELLIVLRGTATLRTQDGERELTEGTVVPFERGAAGSHQLLNRSEGVLRYVMVSTPATLDVVEYVDEARVAAYARTRSQAGEPLAAVFRLDDAVDDDA